jgi:hypothetical protein
MWPLNFLIAQKLPRGARRRQRIAVCSSSCFSLSRRLLALLFPSRALRVFAAPAASLFVTGKVDQGASAAKPASTDAAIELATASRLSDTNVTTARTNLHTASDAFVTDTATGRQRDAKRKRNGLRRVAAAHEAQAQDAVCVAKSSLISRHPSAAKSTIGMPAKFRRFLRHNERRVSHPGPLS